MKAKVSNESSRGEADREAETNRMEKLLGMIAGIIVNRNTYSPVNDDRYLPTSFGGKYRIV
jgi:hypothetical protein